MFEDLDSRVSDVVQHYYMTLSGQAEEHEKSDNVAHGRRPEVLGGQQMNGFAGLVEELLVEAGVPRDAVKHDYHATLPGYYRHEKEWDTAVVYNGNLLAAIEYKSQGSSIGNNLNNRAEEVIGNNTDILKAYEEGLFEPSPAPWIGYLMLFVDDDESRKTRSLREPNEELEFERFARSLVSHVQPISTTSKIHCSTEIYSSFI
ncbi:MULTISPECIES: PaeR7I family type II restriction endonuclease [unclassified Haloferax]|uniref:PaeR7I family type II restriction endonuclease n=1 Tax=unclassified Haloferax TaxID=2625095 RepID=UPI0028758990|nr:MULTISPECIES: PaeR7I family type II restriction endonuclease [unclassified Haloferax]MDS0239964.1 PaeR7I family type II restriction endonuclease [Haloferax sp. S2CR25]MDS0443085.1 PaeR7I family type II restriction endonuclease [Haloferax sp. S2CR25-2]